MRRKLAVHHESVILMGSATPALWLSHEAGSLLINEAGGLRPWPAFLFVGVLGCLAAWVAWRWNRERLAGARLRSLSANLEQEVARRAQIEEALGDKVRVLEILSSVDAIAIQSKSFREAANNLMDLLLDVFRADRAFVLKPLRGDLSEYEIMVEATRPEFPGAGARSLPISISAADRELLTPMLNAPRGVIVFDQKSGNALPEAARSFGVQSMIFSMLLATPGEYWILGMHQCTHPREWTPADQALVREISQRVSVPLGSILLNEALEVSENRFRHLTETIPGIVYQCLPDERWTCVYLSPGFQLFTGIPVADALRQRLGFADLIHPEDLPGILAKVEQAVTSLQSYQLEYRLKGADGAFHWVEEYGCAVLDSRTKRVDYFQGFIHGIEDRKHAERERLANIELTSRLSEITTLRDLGRTMAAAARALFRHDAFFLSQHDTARSVSINIYVEDTPEGENCPVELEVSPTDFERPISSMEAGSEPRHIEQREDTRHPGLHRMGVVERFSRSSLFAPIRWQGRNLGFISVQSYTENHYSDKDLELLKAFAAQCAGTMRRVAAEEELRRNEKIYRDAIHATSGYVYQVTYGPSVDTWTYDFVDPKIEELLGIPASELTPYVFRDLVKELDTSTYAEHGFPEDAGRAFRAGEIPFFHVDTRVQTPTGEEKWLSDHAVAVRDRQSGKIVGSLGILQDVTARKRAEQQLSYSNERLAFIAEVTAGVVGLQPLVEQAHHIAAKVAAVFGVDACVIRVRKGDDEDKLHFLAHHGLPDAAQLPVISANAGISAAMMRERRPVSIPNVNTHPATRQFVSQPNSPYKFISYAGAPLLHESEVLGVVGIYSTEREITFSEEDLEHLQIVANNLAILILNHRLYQTAEEHRAQLEKEIADRRRIEQALRQSEVQYRSMFEISSDGLAIFHVDGTLVECNGALARLHGTSRENIVAGSYSRFVAPDSAAIFEDFLATVRRGRGYNTHLRVRGSEPGSIIDVELQSIPFHLGGKEFVYASIRDITERKRYEDLLNAERNVLELIARGGETERLLELQMRMIESRAPGGHGLVLVLENGETPPRVGAAPSIPAAVAAKFATLDHHSQENPVGRAITLRDMIIVEDAAAPREDKWLPKEIREGGLGTCVLMPIEYPGEGPVGVFIYGYDNVVTPERYHLQLMEMATALMGIVLEREKASRERQKLEAQIQHVQKLESLGILAGGIAHDFNNLLVAILGNAGLALMDLRPEAPARPLVERIETAAQRAADLASQMLAYSGRGRFVVEHIDINLLVEEMTHLLRISISKKAIIKYNLTPNLPLLEADATQLRQVIMNLVTNASDAIGERSGVITLSTGLQIVDTEYLRTTYLNDNLAPGNYLNIEVSDNGCGMDKATAERIFDPFFTTKMTGRGLGLAAVLGIVRGHKGSLKVYSEPGRGTTMKILLPCVPMEIVDLVGEKAGAANHGQWRGDGTVLVADDERSVCAVAKGALEKFGFEVIVAYDGQEAVNLFRANHARISAVLLDLTMPKLNGEEVFRELRQINAAVPVILTSGYSEQDAVARFAGKGLAAFIHKPWRPKDLVDKFREVLDGKTR